MRMISKLFTNKIKSLDEEKRQAQFVISTDQVDRSGEIVAQDWDLEHYKQNPIVLFGHDPSVADNVLGKCLEISTEEEDGVNKTKATVQFADEGTSETVDTVWKLVKQDILRTVSVGFIPHNIKQAKGDDEASVLENNELLEFSIVPIPANPNAVALAYDDGSIDEKDAKFMAKTYTKEAELLNKTICGIMKATTDSSKKQEEIKMSEEEMTKLAEAVGTAVVNALGEKLDAILDAVKPKEDEKPAEEKPEDKPNEKPADNEQPEEKSADEIEQSNANSEQNDEDGAFDENEQLDEEAEKAFLAQLEKIYNEYNK